MILSTDVVFLLCGIALFIYISIGTVVAIKKQRADIADIFWGPGFSLISWISFILSPYSPLSLVITVLVTLWSIRLAVHIFLKKKSTKEDFRYEKLKQSWGKYPNLKLFIEVFLFQGVLCYLIALPILWINTQAVPLTTFSKLCLALWILGFAFESVSDYQLLKFKKDPLNTGKLLTKGLWSYIRHPNYLGEIIQWWAIFAMSTFVPLIISPILLTFLLVKVSGIVPVEEKMRKHPDFQKYAAKTVSLIRLEFVNASIYTLSLGLLVYFGSKGFFWIPLGTFIGSYTFQVALFARFDSQSYLIHLPLTIYSLTIGLLLEIGMIYFNIVSYPSGGILPPLWLICLYPLFALTLNSSLAFLNKSLLLAFILGAIGGFFAYLSGERLGAVMDLSIESYLSIAILWGGFLSVLVLLNRKLIVIAKRCADPRELEGQIVAFFDGRCPLCRREMDALKIRKQTGSVTYESLSSKEEFQKLTDKFSYEQSCKKIHVIKSDGSVVKGTEALAEIYMRTGLPFYALILNAPLFRQLFKIFYATIAKFRVRRA